MSYAIRFEILRVISYIVQPDNSLDAKLFEDRDVVFGREILWI